MTMPCTQVQNSRPGWERFWTYDLSLTCFPDAFPASLKYTTVILSGRRNSSSWRLDSNYTWTTCSREGSGWLEIQKEYVVGIDSLNKHVKQISFRQCVTFREHRQLKGWQPRFQPTLAKSSISTTVLCLQQSHKHNHCTLKILATTTPWPNPLLLCMRLFFPSFSCNEGMGMLQP